VKTILVTGDVGFIGSRLVERLRADGYEIRGIDKRAQEAPRYPHIKGDILDPNAIRLAIGSADCIVHLAAEHKDFGISEESYFRVNEMGTRMLLEEATRQNISRFVFFSSVAVYGDQQGTSEETPCQPTTPYGASKVAAEKAVREWTAADSSRESVIIRPAVVFGPRNTANIFKLIRQVCEGRFVWVGDGRNVKSVAYLENLVDATRFIMKRMTPGLQIYNYADKPHLTTSALVSLIAAKAGRTLPRVHIPFMAATLLARLFDLAGRITGHDYPITSARLTKFNTPTYHKAELIRTVGFSPEFSIEDGIETNVRWYLREGRSIMNGDHSSE
jgi:nucleoside-diphosphate-sugar epimerase